MGIRTDPSAGTGRRRDTRVIDASRAGKPVKTLFGWLIYRRISMPLSLRAARMGINPSAITGAGLACGMAGAAMLATGHYALGIGGALLASAAKVLDAMDGEVARAQHRETHNGYVVDGMSDRLRDTLLIIGLGVGGTAVYGDAAAWWTIAAVAGYLGFFYVSASAPSHWREVRTPADLDVKHSFRVSEHVRLGAGDTLAASTLLVALAGRPLWLVVVIAVLAPVAIAIKVRRLFALAPWSAQADPPSG